MAQAFFEELMAGLEERIRPEPPTVFFHPELVVQIKALACEMPTQHDAPLSRWSVGEITRHI